MVVNLPKDPAIPLFGIYPRDAQSSSKSICSTMFITVLIVIARSLRHPVNGRMNKEIVTLLVIRVLLSGKKNLEFCLKMDGNRNTFQSEITQTQNYDYGMY